MKIDKYPPIKFRVLYKLENAFILFVIPFFLIMIYTFYTIKGFYEFKNTTSKKLLIGQMKIAWFNTPGGAKVGGISAVGNMIIGQNLNSKELAVSIGSTVKENGVKQFKYFDYKYDNVEIGDTIPVWYSSNLDFVEIIPQGGLKGLIEYKKQQKIDAVIFAVNLFLVAFLPYLVFRMLRKYYQKKYKITDEEYKQYVKIAYKK